MSRRGGGKFPATPIIDALSSHDPPNHRLALVSVDTSPARFGPRPSSPRDLSSTIEVRPTALLRSTRALDSAAAPGLGRTPRRASSQLMTSQWKLTTTSVDPRRTSIVASRFIIVDRRRRRLAARPLLRRRGVQDAALPAAGSVDFRHLRKLLPA